MVLKISKAEKDIKVEMWSLKFKLYVLSFVPSFL